MGYSEIMMREIVALAIGLTQGGLETRAHARFEELTGGAIGDVRHRSQFASVYLFAYDPGTMQVVGARRLMGLADDVGIELDRFADQHPGMTCEAWGACWDWHASGGEAQCLATRERPASVDREALRALAHEVLNGFERADAEFEPNAYQKAAIEVYAQGDFRHLAEIRGRRVFDAAVDEVGDTLFRFAMIELDDSEGVEGVHEASRRMATAAADLEELADRILLLPEGPAPG